MIQVSERLTAGRVNRASGRTIARAEVAARVAEARLKLARSRARGRVRAIGNIALRLLQERAIVTRCLFGAVTSKEVPECDDTYSLCCAHELAMKPLLGFATCRDCIFENLEAP